MLDKAFALLEEVASTPGEWHAHTELYEAAAREVRLLRSLPPIVCLCGSGRFKDDILHASEELTLSGHIVLAPNVFAREESQLGKPGRLVTDNEKGLLDVLHFRKIDLSVRVHVINTEGYIGESVHKEIGYAVRTSKLVTFSENRVIPWDTRSKVSISTAHYLKAIQERIAMEGE